jgi:hypothetical protein
MQWNSSKIKCGTVLVRDGNTEHKISKLILSSILIQFTNVFLTKNQQTN